MPNFQFPALISDINKTYSSLDQASAFMAEADQYILLELQTNLQQIFHNHGEGPYY